MKKDIPLNQIEIRQRIIAFALPSVLMIVSCIIVFLGVQKGDQISKKKIELASMQQAKSEKEVFAQFLDTNQLNLESINQVIPDESMMIGVIQDYESVLSQFDPFGTVEIVSAVPSKVGLNLTINLILKCTTHLDNLPKLLENSNKLPYMTQLLSIDTNQTGESYTHQLNMRLYVQDPFNSPQ